MLGIIRSIEEIFNIEHGWLEMDGYKVETSEHKFYVLIDNGQSCCENWGYLTSEDDLEYFIGSELIEVKVTDTTLNQKVLTKMNDAYLEEEDIQFVDFKTDKGVFQLAVYNSHNGFYGHNILIKKDDEILLDDCL